MRERKPTPGNPRVLVVDPEAASRNAVVRALRDHGFVTREAESGKAAERAISDFRPDLLVLEMVLPDVHGFRLARQLRETRRQTPLIFLTASSAPEDKAAGLAVGDDYITKPVSAVEIVARVRALLRRTLGEDDGVLRFADLVLDENAHEVWRAGKLVELTPTEFKLLRFLMLNARRVLTKRQILENVWDDAFRGDPSVVETYISYLRKKLDRSRPPLIQTIRLVGYALREPGR